MKLRHPLFHKQIQRRRAVIQLEDQLDGKSFLLKTAYTLSHQDKVLQASTPLNSYIHSIIKLHQADLNLQHTTCCMPCRCSTNWATKAAQTESLKFMRGQSAFRPHLHKNTPQVNACFIGLLHHLHSHICWTNTHRSNPKSVKSL